MSEDFAGKALFVTGAASGIGKAFATIAADSGATVLAADRDADRLQEVVASLPGNALALTLDVTDSVAVSDAVSRAVAHAGRIDGCFNNAGITAPVVPLPDYNEADFDRIVRVNQYGSFYVLKHVMRQMREQRAGAIVNTASTSGTRGIANFAPYCASKHAVIGLTRVAALEGIEYGVRVNAISPGMTDTPINDSFHAFANPENPGQVRVEFSERIPAKRYAEPEELARVALFLLSDAASYIVGEILDVDGALTTGL